MRGFPLFFSALAALALAGCMHQQQAYYVVDPATGQPVPVVQPYQPQYAQQGYAPPYQQPAPHVADNSRGLFSPSPAAAQQSYAAPTYSQPAYGQQPQYRQPSAPQRPAATGDRGLFSSSRSATPAYVQRTYQAQTYAAQPAYPAQQYAQQQYGRPQYAQAQYRQPQYAMPRSAAGGPYVAAPLRSYAYAAPTAGQPAYTLDSGDKLRVVVFGQDGITNSYIVGADGNVNLPLVGSVPARGFTTAQLSQMIAERLKQGYVREPHVSVEVETYRPFFILGEVTTPGQYPYVANMTAETAVAIAGGFSPRADKRKVQLTRNAPAQSFKGDVPLNYPVRPGDTVVVKERWF
jgi:polysaccharide export outer membrane protein